MAGALPEQIFVDNPSWTSTNPDLVAIPRHPLVSSTRLRVLQRRWLSSSGNFQHSPYTSRSGLTTDGYGHSVQVGWLEKPFYSLAFERRPVGSAKCFSKTQSGGWTSHRADYGVTFTPSLSSQTRGFYTPSESCLNLLQVSLLKGI